MQHRHAPLPVVDHVVEPPDCRRPTQVTTSAVTGPFSIRGCDQRVDPFSSLSREYHTSVRRNTSTWLTASDFSAAISVRKYTCNWLRRPVHDGRLCPLTPAKVFVGRARTVPLLPTRLDVIKAMSCQAGAALRQHLCCDLAKFARRSSITAVDKARPPGGPAGSQPPLPASSRLSRVAASLRHSTGSACTLDRAGAVSG